MGDVTVNRGIGSNIARMPSVGVATRVAAEKIATRARIIADAEGDTGHFSASISAEPKPRRGRNKNDYIVISRDNAASAIEAGHLTSRGRWVPGKMTLYRAAGGTWYA